jgi:alanine dehydrogenase
MKRGAVIVNVAIDHGGCIRTSRPTTHALPTYVVSGVAHYCVTNMPGAVARSSTPALTNATFPYVLEVANKGCQRPARDNSAIASGLNLVHGKVLYPDLSRLYRLLLTSLCAV